MSRYDILLNEPKKDPPQKEHNPPSKPITRPGDEATKRPPDEGAKRLTGEPTDRMMYRLGDANTFVADLNGTRINSGP